MSPRPYRLGARTAAVADTRARVLIAARESFADDGFHHASLDEIARRADVARATVYHRFRSKLGLLEAVVSDFEQRAGLPALVELIENAPADKLVRSVLRAGCKYWATEPPLVRMIISVAVSDADAAHLLADHDAGRLRLVSRMVERLRASHQLARSCSPRRAVDTLWLLTSFSAFDELSQGRGLSIRDAAGVLADLAEPQIYGRRRPDLATTSATDG